MVTINEPERSRTEGKGETKMRLYGIPLPSLPARSQHDAYDQQDNEDTIGIVYCGFKAGSHEVRIPTGRIFSLRKAQVIDSGEVPDYSVSKEIVHYYDVPFLAEVRESESQRISLATEVVTTTGGTFAALVATPPLRPAMDLSKLESMSREDLLERVRMWMTMPKTGEPMFRNDEILRGCEGYCQSYRTTWYGVGHREDAGGADCDPV